jgi:hypothetical protein
MASKKKFDAVCPCCGATLTLDAELGRVIAHQEPPRQSKAPDLDRAAQLLEQEKARREALFKQGAEDERLKSDILERKFRESFEKEKDKPITRPMRDIDLD